VAARSEFPGAELLLGGLRRARHGLWLRQVSQVGRGVVLDGRPFVQNQGFLSLGDGVFLASRPVQSHLVVGQGGRLEIGRGALIAYGAAISAQSEVQIGENTRVGPLVVIMDSDFHVAGDRDAHAEPKPIRLGSGVVIESRVTVLRGSSIGDGARVRSGSVVSGHVPAGVTVAGVPAGVWSEQAPATDGAELDVASVVMSALNLPAPPNPSDGPEQIAQWDSFGALKLLLALERAFQVTIREEQLKSAHSIGDLVEVIEAARRAAAPP
jgi:acetyltransferase-like isoleucine patch superfamily enzyme/acyl carrier protein